MLKIGITGGIGSGKSTVCKAFELLHVPVYYADSEAKKIIIEDLGVKGEIINLFGNEAYGLDGSYNTSYIRTKVFQDQQLLNKLNQIVHPAVRAHWDEWSAQKAEEGHAYILKEAAIMDKNQGLDHIIYVHASEETRIARTLKRDPEKSRETVLSIIAKQKSDTEFNSISDYIIENEHSLVFPQVLKLHQLFTS